MKSTKSLLGIVVALALIVIGYNLTHKENTFTIVIGYASMAFWSTILLFALYKKITTRKINK